MDGWLTGGRVPSGHGAPGSKLRRFKRKLEAAMVARDSKAPRGADRNPRDAGPVSASGKVNYCVATVAFTLLGAKVFDGRPLLTACSLHTTGKCIFEHKLPVVPYPAMSWWT